MRDRLLIVLTGTTVGLLAVTLMVFGNPVNMGMCVACFLRDFAGGLGLHSAAAVQYVRPEILGLVLGAFLAALGTREFRVTGGSSPFIRFALGFFAIIGFLVFLGCPLRAIIRLSAGDLNALVGLAGLVAGIGIGIWLLSKGFTLGRATALPKANGAIFPGFLMVILVLVLGGATFLKASQEGPGSMQAPLAMALGAGLIIGLMAQRSRLCFVGGFREFMFFRDSYLLTGLLVIFFTALTGNLVVGNFNPGFSGQPVAHTDGLWNFLGMVLAGLACTLAAGCPLRQLVAAAEGNTDAAITVIGMLVGAATAHNFGLAASPAGVTLNGQIMVVGGLVVVLALGLVLSSALFTERRMASGG